MSDFPTTRISLLMQIRDTATIGAPRRPSLKRSSTYRSIQLAHTAVIMIARFIRAAPRPVRHPMPHCRYHGYTGRLLKMGRE